jgi:hypothetical protein
VEALFTRVHAEQGRLDLLVSNVNAFPQRSELPEGVRSLWDLHPFWEVPIRPSPASTGIELAAADVNGRARFAECECDPLPRPRLAQGTTAT